MKKVEKQEDVLAGYLVYLDRLSRTIEISDKKLKELREGKDQIVIVEFDYRVEDAFLLKLPKVKSVINTHDFVYEITFSSQEDMRSYVFDFAHDNQLKILQLNQKNASLESFFRELTS